MEIDLLKKVILSLPSADRDLLLKDLTNSLQGSDLSNQSSRLHILNNKKGLYPHC